MVFDNFVIVSSHVVSAQPKIHELREGSLNLVFNVSEALMSVVYDNTIFLIVCFYVSFFLISQIVELLRNHRNC
jgi:hypothetical protein